MVRDADANLRASGLLETDLLETLFASLGAGVYATDHVAGSGGAVLLANPACGELLGYSVEELLGVNMHDLVHHSRPDGTPLRVEECELFSVSQTGVGKSGLDTFWRRDGSALPVAWSSAPLTRAGTVVGVVVAFTDDSARSSAMAAREVALAREREARHRLAGLTNVAAALVGAADLDEVLQVVLAGVVNTMGVHGGVLGVWDRDVLRCLGVGMVPAGHRLGRRDLRPDHDDLLTHVARSGEGRSADGVVTVPLRQGAELLGALCLPGGDVERPLLDALLSIAAQAVTRVRTAENARRADSRLSLLSKVSAELATATDLPGASAVLLDLAVPELAVWGAVAVPGSATARGWTVAAAQHTDPDRSGRVRALAEEAARSLLDNAAFADLGVAALRGLDPPALDVVLPPELRAELRALEGEHVLLSPLVTAGRVLGVLGLARSDAAFTPAQADAVHAMSARAAISLEALQTSVREHEAAVAFQQALLTELPQPDHLELVARYLPAAESMQVGGDWYDAFVQPDGSTMLVVGDVMGHDVNAAALMGQLRNLLRGVAYDRDDSPAEVLSRVDRMVAGLEVEALATVCVARIEQGDELRRTGHRLLRWASAGHPPAAVVTADGVVTLLDGSDELMLGVDPDTTRADRTHLLEPGSTVAMYTDGLVERRGQTLETGMDRLTRVLETFAGAELGALCDALVTALLDGDRDDDVALIGVRMQRQDLSPAG